MYVNVEEMMYNRLLICGKKIMYIDWLKKKDTNRFSWWIFSRFLYVGMENFHTMYNVYKYEIFSCIHAYANLHVRLWNEMYVRRNGIEH
jgi:hypothetical protein